jgi:SAM-dependent methyltransferase
MVPESRLYMQYGAGLCGPEHWLNFDVSPVLRAQRLPFVGRLFRNVSPQFPNTIRYGDIVRGLPLRDGSCAAIYCSHVLEHLALNDFRTAIRNTRRYLVAGGRFRFVVPDLERLARRYVASETGDAAIEFLDSSGLGVRKRRTGLQGLIRAWLGNSAHLWMWDYKSVAAELADGGFERIRLAAVGDSGDSMFATVEEPDRWNGCLGVECFRPAID